MNRDNDSFLDQIVEQRYQPLTLYFPGIVQFIRTSSVWQGGYGLILLSEVTIDSLPRRDIKKVGVQAGKIHCNGLKKRLRYEQKNSDIGNILL